MKSGLEFFYFKIQRAPLELLLPSAKNLPREDVLAWQVSRYLWGWMNLKIHRASSELLLPIAKKSAQNG